MNVNVPPKIGHYQIRGTIGQGAFSVVKLAFDERNKQYMACKVVPRSRISSAELEERFQIEIKIFRQLSHPGIVTLYDLLKDELNFYVFMEFCPNGELFQHIVDNGKLTEDEGKVVVYQLFSSLQYIHELGIAHRDLKPENMLLAEDGSIKLSDFGLSRYVGESGLADTPCGSPCYASPECISGNRYNAITSDIWSSGVIIFAMLTGQLPWTKRNQAQLFKQIRKGEYSVPNFLSFECQDFIRGLMTVDIEKRLTIPQALQHPWMQGAEEMVKKVNFVPKTFVSLKKVDIFFSSDASEPLYIDDRVLFRNKSARNMDFIKAARALKLSSLPKVSKQKGSNTPSGPPLPANTLKAVSKRKLSTVMKRSTLSRQFSRKSSVLIPKVQGKK